MDPDELVAELARRPSRSGVLLDVDGTLAPIVARPELARVLPEALVALERLAGRLGVVAAISGRRSEEVRELVPIDGVEAVGTHGLESEPPIAPDVLRTIQEVAGSVGAWVEVKGAAVAVHFRGIDEPAAAAATVEPALASVAAAHGLELLGGKRILELMPAGRPRKGGAVERIARERELEVVVFVGDDVGDLDAFEALTRLRARGAWTCGVASVGPETTPAVAEAADLAVEGPAGVASLLGAIADALGA
jgi:trehalose 6-phosphate phosphatase